MKKNIVIAITLIILLVLGGCAKKPSFAHYGTYTDMQGTTDVYSELVIAKSTDGIAVEMVLYRLASLSGAAEYDANKDELIFSDTSLGVVGTIQFSEEGATFCVTESEWDLLDVGEEYDFFD